MKILIIAGHGAGDTGACGCGYKEADLTRKAASILEGKLEAYDCTVVRYPSARNAYEDNKAGNLKVPFKGFGLVIEIHFNSYNGTAHGCEVLYRPPSMQRLSAKVSAAIASCGFLNRGAKKRTDLMNMNTCNRLGVPYILIETAFVDNKADMKRYSEEVYTVWDKVADAVCSFYGLKKLANAGKPVETSKTSSDKKKPVKSTKKSLTEVAKEVIEGKYGNGDARKKKLKAEGYDPDKVQAKVNELLKPKKKSIDTIAKEVINGKWGNGEERKKKLKAAGYDPATVQKRVNALLK